MSNPDREPSTHQNSIVSFWSKPIRDRLSRSTLSPGQAAKRDLARYHRLIEGSAPRIGARTAGHLVESFRRDPESTQGYRWIKTVTTDRVECLALLDAADRCIAELDRDPGAHLADVVARHFRITPERS